MNHPRRLILLGLLVFVLLLATSGCSAQDATGPGSTTDAPHVSGTPSTSAPSTDGELALVPPGAPADYQLGGPYAPPAGVTVVTRDSTATPVPGIFNICYVNGFQTQPADRALWLNEHRSLLLFDRGGRPRSDPKWPDELIIDTSTAAKRDSLADVIGKSIRRCAQSGFQAVEVDNLDSYTRSGGALTEEDNLAFAKKLADIAHGLSMAIGQKNAAELGARGKEEVGFDFVVAEECQRFAECGTYTAVYGQRVIDIEYTDGLGGTVDEVCADPTRPASTIIRDRRLVTPTSSEYRYHRC